MTDQVDKDKKELEAAKLEFENFVNTDGGAIWVRNMARTCMTMQTTFTGNSQTFYNEGTRAVGITLLKETAQVSPNAFAQIMKELI